MRPIKTIVIVLCVLGWQAATAWADEVTLKNGDRLSGDILKMGEGILVLKTTYAGEVKIEWKDIREITSKAPVKVQTLDGSVLQGVVTSPSAEQIVVTSDQFGATMSIPFTNIQAINPPPNVTYSGAFNLAGSSPRAIQIPRRSTHPDCIPCVPIGIDSRSKANIITGNSPKRSMSATLWRNSNMISFSPSGSFWIPLRCSSRTLLKT